MNRFRLAAAALVSFTLVTSACTGDLADQTVPAVESTTTSSFGVPDSTTSSSANPGSAPTSTTTTTKPLDDIVLRSVEVDTGFDSPVLLVAAPDAGHDIVVEQSGRLVRADGAEHDIVLDMRSDVDFAGEKGLLGFAAHPDFADNGRVYVNYVAPGPVTVIAEFVLANGKVDPTSRREVLRIQQPARNHNGGMIAFGPDGYLWIGMGDGGASNDRFENGQDASTLLGSMLRIDVGPGANPYAIPSDNPFAAGSGGASEVWAIGLRNPWRFAFDGADLWIADVGQERFEEVNVTDASEAGLNYGWNTMEGSACFVNETCDSAGLVLPVTEYQHPLGCSITGGVVYRGDAIPSLRGQFLFADYCSGLFRSVDSAGAEHDWTDTMEVSGNITGFGTGSDGEAYYLTQQGGLFRVVGEG